MCRLSKLAIFIALLASVSEASLLPSPARKLKMSDPMWSSDCKRHQIDIFDVPGKEDEPLIYSGIVDQLTC